MFVDMEFLVRGRYVIVRVAMLELVFSDVDFLPCDLYVIVHVVLCLLRCRSDLWA
jgi:hypothetical protein